MTAIDVVGLNHPQLARTPATRAFLDDVKPGLIFLHVVDVFDIRKLRPPDMTWMHRVAPETLRASVTPPIAEAFDTPIAQYDSRLNRPAQGAVALGQYMLSSGQYDMYVTGWFHLWGVAKWLPGWDKLAERLAVDRRDEVVLSYAQLRGFPAADAVAKMLADSGYRRLRVLVPPP